MSSLLARQQKELDTAKVILSKSKLLYSLSQRDLKIVRQVLLKSTDTAIRKRETAYRVLCKTGWTLRNPVKARNIEQSILYQRAQHQAQLKGKSKNDIDLKKFIDDLASTSELYDTIEPLKDSALGRVHST